MPAAGGSDASARTCVTSGWRSQWPLPSPRTIAHSARRRQGPGERHELHYTATFRKRLSSQGRVLRHVVAHLSVPALDVPVPQMVDQLLDIEQFSRVLSPDPEQVVEVPKILLLDVPMRAALRVTQLVEQLVEDRVLLFVTADCGTARRHSSSWWWRTKFWSSCFFPRTAFNIVAYQKTHF